MSEQELKQSLKDIGHGDIRFFEEISSTSSYALKWINENPPEYSLAAANYQSKGYGRHNRIWITHPDSALAFSFIVYPDKDEISKLALFSPLAACALFQAVEDIVPDAPISIKWPNDLLLKGKKTAGILAESCWQGEKFVGVVIGIGVNVLTASVPPQEGLLFPATCLEEVLHNKSDRWQILAGVLKHFMLLRQDFPGERFLQYWRSKLDFIGKQIYISDQSGSMREGIFSGVDKNGYLLLKEKSGRIFHFPLGDVSLRPG